MHEIKILVTEDTIDLIIDEIKEMNRLAESIRIHFPGGSENRQVDYKKNFIQNTYVLIVRAHVPELFYELGLRCSNIFRRSLENHFAKIKSG